MKTLLRPLNALTFAGLLTIGLILVTVDTVRAQEPASKKAPTIQKTTGTFKSGTATIQFIQWGPVGGAKVPVVILLHGSDGWEDTSRYQFPADGLAAKGYIVILIRYYDRTNTPNQITPKQRAEFVRWMKGDAVDEKNNEARKHFEEWVETVRDAVAYARTLSNADGDRIAIAGFSLGGYLALAAASKCDPPVAAVVGMFGGLPEEWRKNLGNLPPTLLVHGELDDVVSVNETYKAAGIVLAQKQQVEILIYKGLGHVLVNPRTGEPDKLSLWTARNRMTSFLSKHLEPAAARRVAAEK